MINIKRVNQLSNIMLNGLRSLKSKLPWGSPAQASKTPLKWTRLTSPSLETQFLSALNSKPVQGCCGNS